MADAKQTSALDMNAEIALNQQQQQTAAEQQEIAAQYDQLMRARGLEDERNPLAAEKIQRDLDYQRQVEMLPQPDSAPLPPDVTTPGTDRLEAMQRELDAAKAEATRWKKEFGRREGTVGQMKNELATLKAQVSQIQPHINVQQITGRAPDEPITAQDAVNLLMSQSSAFGNAMARLREELLAQAAPAQNDGLPLDMEAELVESHPWLTDLPRPNKLRAMHDILAASGVTVTPPAPAGTAQPSSTPTLPPQARAPVRQVAFIESSNKGSAAERNSIAPERQALNEKWSQLKDLANKPGGSEEMLKILSSLGAGLTDETQLGYLNRRR